MEQIIRDQVYHQITFFEFEEIFQALQAGGIQESDYKNFGLFRDSELATFTGISLKKRLEKNRELFDFVKKSHEYGYDNDLLEQKFSSSGSKLKNEKWHQLDFVDVLKFHHEAEELNKKTKISFNEIISKNKLKIWDRPQKENAAGKRKRHIIIFNKNQEDVLLTANFKIEGGGIKSLSEKYVKITGNKSKKTTSVSVGRVNLSIHIQPEHNKVTFTKITYRHDNKTSLGAELFIAVVPSEPLLMETFKSCYIVDPKAEVIRIQFHGGKFIIGDGIERQHIQLHNKQIVEYLPDQQLVIEPLPESFDDEDHLYFQLRLSESETLIPFSLVNEIPESVPISSERIWKLKREHQQDFEYVNNRLIWGNQEFYISQEFRQFYEWELKWIDSSLKCGELISGELLPPDEELEISDNLKEAYSRFINYFSSKSSVPSLCYLSSELKKRAREYIKSYIEEIETFQEGQPAGKKGKDLFKLGTLITPQGLYLTPFHPLMISYQLQLYEVVAQEEVEHTILSRLKPDAIVPYLYGNRDELLRPYPHNGASEWLEYRSIKQISVSDSNKYLNKVILDKLKQFQEHFNFLFLQNSKAPLKINIINIENDHEIVHGILQYFVEQIKSSGINSIKPIEVSLYRNSIDESAFDTFSKIQTTEELHSVFGISLSKIQEYEASDVLRAIQNHLFYFKREEGQEFEYAHITFYKMNAQEKHAILPMDDMITGMALGGLYSFVPSMKGRENYRSGFGVKYQPVDSDNLLLNTAISFNELCANLRNGGHDSYQKRVTIVSRTTTADEKYLKRIYQASHWVTFVDSNVDLDFFMNVEKELMVIHYSDQYSSSTKYDAITVTNKTDQYKTVIREFLNEKKVETNEENIKQAIQAFNTFNGEWLLRIVGNRENYSKEKLSIVSGIKYMLAYFDHQDILWVPISLEEILRVAGAASLNKSDGIFTAKNLNAHGVHSDDLLLLGMENNKEHINFHFYPVEVKYGYNGTSVLDKAKDQVKKTKQLFLNNIINNSEHPFSAKFYRYFFVQLFLSNANKLNISKFWAEKNYKIPEEVITKLLDDDFNITTAHEQHIGKGAVLLFQHNVFHRSAVLEDEVTIITLPIQDGSNGIVNSVQDLRNRIQQQNSDFIKENLLSSQYIDHSKKTAEKVLTSDDANHKDKISDHDSISFNEVETDNQAKKEEACVPIIKQTTDEDFQNIRILLGKAENSNHNVYWEFGNSELPNRHILISGKSGQGKTYFMQCLLLELSKYGITSIVIDYTEGFLPNQLEPEFKQFLDSKLIQKIIYTEQFPINPFKKNVRDIGGISLPENDTDVAERIKSVFSSVYHSLGIQQLNAIYEATLSGLKKYGEKMNLDYLKNCLQEDPSNYAKTALSQIRPLIDRNPFSQEGSLKWNEILNEKGKVFIVQLTGYPRDVQLIITEFILWDLWNYSLRFGQKHIPIPVLMDEAQNLDHSENSPSAKIMTEGRKFGWSGWYATQFLKSQLHVDEIARLQNAAQKIYFAQPEQEIAYVASSLTSDPAEKRHYESKLASLKKGQCIVHGPTALSDKNLTAPIPTIVNITPLSERIN